MRPTGSVLGPVLRGFALALLVPLVSAFALDSMFADTSWYTEGRISAKILNRRIRGGTYLYLDYHSNGTFRLEDPADLELTGPYVVTGKKGNRSEGTLDAFSRTVLEDGIEEAIETETGEPFTVTLRSSSVKGKITKAGTLLKVKVKLLLDAHRTLTGRTYRVKETVNAKGGQYGT